MISRRQLVELGLTAAEAKADINSGRWQRIFPGVYATYTGPVGSIGQIWGAVLYAGRGAAASHHAALWLWTIVDEPPAVIDIVIPESRRVTTQPGIRLHRRRGLENAALRPMTHPSAQPPRLRVEEAVLDLCNASTESRAVDLIIQATQRRTTTAGRLRLAMGQRQLQRWRGLILQVLSEVEDGVASPLESRYRKEVERVHSLPPGIRNAPERKPGGGNWYRDVRYGAWHVVVELDGRESHPAVGAFRDMRRDNMATAAGDAVLRYGWRDIVGNPCGVALQVGAVLRLGGWTGQLRPCGTTCSVGAPT